MRPTIRCAVRSTCLALLASLDSGRGRLGRARTVPWQRVLFSIFVKMSKRLHVHIARYKYIPISVYVYNIVG